MKIKDVFVIMLWAVFVFLLFYTDTLGEMLRYVLDLFCSVKVKK